MKLNESDIKTLGLTFGGKRIFKNILGEVKVSCMLFDVIYIICTYNVHERLCGFKEQMCVWVYQLSAANGTITH